MTDEELKQHGIRPVAYGLGENNPYKAEYRGTGLWAVVDGLGHCLNKAGEWEMEPRPSNRDQPFFERCRFLRDEALQRLAELQKEPY